MISCPLFCCIGVEWRILAVCVVSTVSTSVCEGCSDIFHIRASSGTSHACPKAAPHVSRVHPIFLISTHLIPHFVILCCDHACLLCYIRVVQGIGFITDDSCQLFILIFTFAATKCNKSVVYRLYIIPSL